MSGWIKLHRKLTDWEWYDDVNVRLVFLHLLVTVNYKPSQYKGVTIPAGSRVAGIHALSAQVGLTNQKVRTALDKLKSTGEITIKTTNKFSVISIRCWDDYQDDNKQITNHQQTDNKRITTSKESKKVRSEEEVSIATRATRISDTWLPDESDTNHAYQKGYTNDQIDTLGQEFKDHWIAASGRGSTARDWNAKWRTWISNDIKWNGEPAKRTHSGNASRGNKSTRSFAEITADVIGRMEQRD